MMISLQYFEEKIQRSREIKTMAYRNNNPVFMYPKDPKKRMWLTNYAGIVDADWKEKCCTPIIFLDIDGVLNSGDWAEELYKNPNPNYHNFVILKQLIC